MSKLDTAWTYSNYSFRQLSFAILSVAQRLEHSLDQDDATVYFNLNSFTVET